MLFKKGEYQKAIRELELDLRLRHDPDILLNLGHAHRRLGHHREAIQNYQDYLAAVPALDQKVKDDIRRYIEQEQEALVKAGPGNAEAMNPPQQEDIRPLLQSPDHQSAAQGAAYRVPAAAPPIALSTVLPTEDRTKPAATGTPTARTVKTGAPLRPLYQRWWFWTALGVVAVGATIGTVLATYPRESSYSNLRIVEF